MNRRERRNLEKQLGITKQKQSMSVKEKFNRIKENQDHGRSLHAEFLKNSEVEQQKSIDEKQSNSIESLATTIVTRDKIPYIDALAQAKSEIESIN